MVVHVDPLALGASSLLPAVVAALRLAPPAARPAPPLPLVTRFIDIGLRAFWAFSSLSVSSTSASAPWPMKVAVTSSKDEYLSPIPVDTDRPAPRLPPFCPEDLRILNSRILATTTTSRQFSYSAFIARTSAVLPSPSRSLALLPVDTRTMSSTPASLGPHCAR